MEYEFSRVSHPFYESCLHNLPLLLWVRTVHGVALKKCKETLKVFH